VHTLSLIILKAILIVNSQQEKGNATSTSRHPRMNFHITLEVSRYGGIKIASNTIVMIFTYSLNESGF